MSPTGPRLLGGVLLILSAVIVQAGEQPPVVFKVSEGVRPNEVVSIYGQYLTGTPQVRFIGVDNSTIATVPAVQSDPGGHFCRVIFPALPPGAYHLTVSNAAGWSAQEMCVNRAEPRWISEERAYPGLKMKLIGRNLDAAQYGGQQRTEVRFVSGEGNIATSIKPNVVNPYCIDFQVPADLSTGSYHIEVNTHGAAFGNSWTRLDNHSVYPAKIDETVIHVEMPTHDPEARTLNVAWANDFNWVNVIAIPPENDGQPDCTAVIQKALDDASAAGGGIVRLPKGAFRIQQLTFPPKVILRGESQENTTLMPTKAIDPVITVKGQLQGIDDLTVRYAPDVPAAAQSTVVGGDANGLFLHRVTFDMLRKPDVSADQSPYYVKGNGPMLIADCRFFISSRNMWDHQVRQGVTFRDNFIDMHAGLGLCMSSERLLVLHNQLVFHPAPYAGQMNGFFFNEGWMGWNIFNAYIADNVASGLNGPGDCQPYCADSAWSCFAGSVVSVAKDSVDVRLDVSGEMKEVATRELELMVTQGAGLGQFRRVSTLTKLGGNPPVMRMTVCPPWDVAPDSSSFATVGGWHVNNVFFHNAAHVSNSPYNMYYGGAYDCVDADGISDNTEGWMDWGRTGEMSEHPAWDCPVYFDQLRNSVFTGKSSRSGTMGITMRMENETKTYRGIGNYGTEIRDNVIDRAACADKPQHLAGTAAIATFNQSWCPIDANTPLVFAALCEGNTIKNSAAGFDVPGSFAFAIRGNHYENCPKSIDHTGYNTVVLDDAPTPKPESK